MNFKFIIIRICYVVYLHFSVAHFLFGLLSTLISYALNICTKLSKKMHVIFCHLNMQIFKWFIIGFSFDKCIN